MRQVFGVNRRVILSAGITFGLLLGAYILIGPEYFNSSPRSHSRMDLDAANTTVGAESPYTIVVSGYPLVVPPEALAHLSDIIVRGQIVLVGEARWSTPDGRPPADFLPGRPPDRPFVIYRTGIVRVDDVAYGDAPGEVPVALRGGTADGVTVSAADLGPQLKLGDVVVLALKAPAPNTQLDPSNWGIVQSYVVLGGQARNEFVPELPVTELLRRVRAGSASESAASNSSQ